MQVALAQAAFEDHATRPWAAIVASALQWALSAAFSQLVCEHSAAGRILQPGCCSVGFDVALTGPRPLHWQRCWCTQPLLQRGAGNLSSDACRRRVARFLPCTGLWRLRRRGRLRSRHFQSLTPGGRCCWQERRQLVGGRLARAARRRHHLGWCPRPHLQQSVRYGSQPRPRCSFGTGPLAGDRSRRLPRRRLAEGSLSLAGCWRHRGRWRRCSHSRACRRSPLRHRCCLGTLGSVGGHSHAQRPQSHAVGSWSWASTRRRGVGSHCAAVRRVATARCTAAAAARVSLGMRRERPRWRLRRLAGCRPHHTRVGRVRPWSAATAELGGRAVGHAAAGGMHLRYVQVHGTHAALAALVAPLVGQAGHARPSTHAPERFAVRPRLPQTSCGRCCCRPALRAAAQQRSPACRHRRRSHARAHAAPALRRMQPMMPPQGQRQQDPCAYRTTRT
mmetsp:Transcript_7834/g.23560  ORF Transcript_7834/g.23560 Transcript_7834/m.23560 type:complete len:448 (+) Transcript_7834:463-1806(+)|eukprot:7671-Chlamydomonas_euryale.AAC.8